MNVHDQDLITIDAGQGSIRLSAVPELIRSGGEGGFAVLDVETTGLSPRMHRVLEIAVISTDPTGQILDEWCTRLNPDGPVGATTIHGITDDDVRDAPRFPDIADELAARLQGRALVAHNARFDLAFVRAEFARLGWALPPLPTLCTMEASRYYLPQLTKRRLADCCSASGIRLTHAHSALGDTRATAELLRAYLDLAVGPRPLAEHQRLPADALKVLWPDWPH